MENSLAREWEPFYTRIETQLNAKKKKAKTPNALKENAAAKKCADALRKVRKPHWAFIGKTIKDRTKPVDLPSDLDRVLITKVLR